MTHYSQHITKSLTGARTAALILLLGASVSGGFLIHADTADHQPMAAELHATQDGAKPIGTPLGSLFQASAAEERPDREDCRRGMPLGSLFQVHAAGERPDREDCRFGMPLGGLYQVSLTDDTNRAGDRRDPTALGDQFQISSEDRETVARQGIAVAWRGDD